MTDIQIIDLFFQRVEAAIAHLAEKYGSLCRGIARRILWDIRDVDECVNDTWVRTWNVIPPQRPNHLGNFVGRITRNLALDRLDYNQAAKRDTALETALEGAFWELNQDLPDPTGDMTEKAAFRDFFDRFLRRQSEEARRFFLRRYWYGMSIQEIARECGVSEEKVKSSLFRTRNKLREAMEKEGIHI